MKERFNRGTAIDSSDLGSEHVRAVFSALSPLFYGEGGRKRSEEEETTLPLGHLGENTIDSKCKSCVAGYQMRSTVRARAERTSSLLSEPTDATALATSTLLPQGD